MTPTARFRRRPVLPPRALGASHPAVNSGPGAPSMSAVNAVSVRAQTSEVVSCPSILWS
jgi:hypothetical protein